MHTIQIRQIKLELTLTRFWVLDVLVGSLDQGCAQIESGREYYTSFVLMLWSLAGKEENEIPGCAGIYTLRGGFVQLCPIGL